MKYIIPLLLLITLSCEDEIICDASFRTNKVYTPDTLEYYEVVDIERDSIIYSDSNVIGNIPVINDSYLSVIGRNNTVGLNIRYIPVNSNLHVIGLCAYSDNCHIYTPRTLDTLVIQ
jgi:hypothetical protein